MTEQHDTSTNPAPDPEPLRAANIVLSDPFLAALDERQIAAYVDAVAVAAGSGEDDQERLEAGLRERIGGAGIDLPDESYRNLARQIRDSAGQLMISTNDGQVLYAAPAVPPDPEVPDVHGTDDPEDPDRPFYS
ncbi:MAG: hypothetical protein V9G19_23935 [Tetrasphaera sp.]